MLMHIEDGERRSGRTSRMMKDAVALAKAGKTVVVLAATQSEARVLMRHEALAGLPPGQGPKILCLRHEELCHVIKEGRLPGGPVSTRLFIDHWAWTQYEQTAATPRLHPFLAKE